jgi:hypothetical protein
MQYTVKRFKNQISHETPGTQTTEVSILSRGWTMHYQSYGWLEPILASMRTNDGNIRVSRNDIFNTGNRRERLVKILFWGYPSAFRDSNYLNSILGSIDSIIKYLPVFNSRLSQNHFLQLYRNLSGINGLSESTISKILCFWGLKIASSEAVIVDQFVLECCHLYDDFWDIEVFNRGGEQYLKVVKKINRLARSICVEPQQLELFLFKSGKAIKETRRSLYRSLLSYSGLAISEEDKNQE